MLNHRKNITKRARELGDDDKKRNVDKPEDAMDFYKEFPKTFQQALEAAAADM